MVTPQQEILLKRYAEAVVGAPAHLHLTSDRDLNRFWSRHVQDAVKLSELIPPQYRKAGLRVLDVGSGNGIPGVPLAIMEPSWHVELLDSDNKKCGFLDMFCHNNAIINARVIAGRAESLAQGPLRECFGIVFSRAVGKLRVAIELAGAFVAVDGILIVPHGTSMRHEIKESSSSMELLGFHLENIIEYGIDSVRFFAILMRKVKESPRMYPRPVGVPGKKPL